LLGDFAPGIALAWLSPRDFPMSHAWSDLLMRQGGFQPSTCKVCNHPLPPEAAAIDKDKYGQSWHQPCPGLQVRLTQARIQATKKSLNSQISRRTLRFEGGAKDPDWQPTEWENVWFPAARPCGRGFSFLACFLHGFSADLSRARRWLWRCCNREPRAATEALGLAGVVSKLLSRLR
jgi:hypothetical protein